MTPRLASALSLFAAIAVSLGAQTKIPEGENLLWRPGINGLGLELMPGMFDAVNVKVIKVEGAPGFTDALHVETLRDAGFPFAIQLRGIVRRGMAKGDVGLIRFFARTIKSADESGSGRVMVAFRRGAGFRGGSVQESFSPPREWTEYFVPFRCAEDYEPFEAALTFSVGFRRQTVEIGGLDCVYYGTKVAFDDLPRTRFTYEGREADAPWRKAALERIEKIRKGDLTVTVVDASGKPVPNATVKLDETRSAFQFGSAVEFGRLLKDSPDNERYRKTFLELFNAASAENNLKWPAWIGENLTTSDGRRFDRAQAMAGLNWLRDHHITTRGHVLVWPGWNNLPKMIRDLRDTPKQNEIPGLVLEHIRDEGAATRDYLVDFDVLNEPMTNHDLMDLFGQEIMVDWFKTAREVMPHVGLYLNDFSNQDATTDKAHVEYFEKIARYLLDHGAPVTGLGLQAHIGGQPNAPVNVLATLDRYWNEFKLPMRITEFDIRTTDEQLQADYTRDFYILAFSHPAIIGIQAWGFWEKNHWIPVAAMYRNDWSEKPNAEAYKSLVLHQWRTHTTGATAADGSLATRAFYGDYDVTVEANGKTAKTTFTLSKDKPGNVVVKLP